MASETKHGPGLKVVAVVPALNEEGAIATVVSRLLALTDYGGRARLAQVIVCDNGSTDDTRRIALDAGAKVVFEPVPGYGRACMAAIDALPDCDAVLFVDGDDSCVIDQANRLIDGIQAGADVAIGSRVLGRAERGALTVPQLFGNWLSAKLINLFWGEQVTDLGPFRAIRTKALQALDMQERTFGWTVEMQIKAIQHGLVMREYPVDSKVRIGKSKISGTVKGTIGAGVGILGTIFKLRWRDAS